MSQKKRLLVVGAVVTTVVAAAGIWFARISARGVNSVEPDYRARQAATQGADAGVSAMPGGVTADAAAAGATPVVGARLTDPVRLFPPLPFAGPQAGATNGSRRETQESIAEWEMQGRAIAVSAAAKYGWLTEGESNGRTFKLMAIRNGRVYRYATCNVNAAISSAAHKVRQTAPYSVGGDGVTVGLWDAGSPRPTHRELNGRVSLKNSAAVHYHSTHVAGTIAATGIDANAKGMAPLSRINSYDWDYDSSEMSAAGMSAEGETGVIQISNHSYGLQTGWEGTEWFGTWDTRTEADGFGLYDVYAATWDTVCYGTPYYLPFKSAGNDRSDPAPAPGTMFSYYDGNLWRTKPYDPQTDPPRDGWDNGGYDTVTVIGNAKNIMTVGAANDAISSGVRNPALATMTSFSAWGPADDGRIKPDIVANGSGLWSTYSSSDSSYAALSGTSMAAPNAAGSAALLVDLYSRLFPGKAMLASTLKGLIIHTADDIGRPGPDYVNGWGLMNTEAAAALIRSHHGSVDCGRIATGVIAGPGQVKQHEFVWDGTSPLKVTICWTDYPGVPRDTLDDRTPVLVNDLDLRVIDPAGATHFPYVLSVTNPAAPAVTGDNNVDNVEQVHISNPPTTGVYRAMVYLDGDLTGSAQPYSFVVSGATYPPRIEHTALANTTNSTAPYVVEAEIYFDSALVDGGATLFYRIGDGTNPPFLSTSMDLVSNSLYAGAIPAQPVGSHIRYYIEAATVNGLATTAPPEGASAPFSFYVSAPVSLDIRWKPVEVGATEPPYGRTLYASGTVIRASADAHTESFGGFRYDCYGWTGTGSVPATGSTNSATLTLERDSSLTWVWQPTFRLLQESSLPGLLCATNWWPVGQNAETVTAQPVFGGSVSIHFAGWYVDGARMPDATSAADNPATNIVMSLPRRAEALYMLDFVNDDGDSLPDWWEFLYFGSTSAVHNIDSDDDGFTNLKEFQDGTNPRDPTSIPSAPSIAHIPFTSTRTTPAPWHVSAAVTDNHAVGNVSVVWTRNGGPQQSLPMTYNAALGYYETTFGEPGVTGDTFSYRIEARDAASLQASSGPFVFDVAYPLSVVTPDDFGTLYLPAMTSTDLLVVVSNAGHRTLDWSASVELGGLSNSVESGIQGWTHSGAKDVWHISTNRAYSGNHSWCFGSASGGNYPDKANAALVSPDILLSSSARLTYMQWLDTEPPKNAIHAWDGCFVELSTNGGASFFQIEPVGGYSHIIFGHSESPYPEGTPCFTGSGGWQRIEFDLSEYELQSVRIAFRFGSDGYVTGKGWYVDDIVVSPYSGSHEWIDIAPAQGAIDSAKATQITVRVSTENIPPGTTLAGGVRISSNDPVRPRTVVPVFLHNLSRVVTVTQPANGSIEPSGQVFLLRGDSTNFVVSADPYYGISHIVTNGVTNTLSAQEAVTVTNIIWKNVTENGSITALMKANTATNDVPVWWLASYGLATGNVDSTVMLDQDGDTMATWAEYIAGTDPTETTSVLSIVSATPLEQVLSESVVTNDGVVWTNRQCVLTGLVLRWPSVSNRVYSVQSGEASPGEIAPGTTGYIPATPPHNTTTQSVDGLPTQFYRIGVSLP